MKKVLLIGAFGLGLCGMVLGSQPVPQVKSTAPTSQESTQEIFEKIHYNKKDNRSLYVVDDVSTMNKHKNRLNAGSLYFYVLENNALFNYQKKKSKQIQINITKENFSQKAPFFGIDIQSMSDQNQEAMDPLDAYLFQAVTDGNLNRVRFALKVGASGNIQNEGGWTLLHIASEYGYLNIVKLLVEQNGIDINAKGEDQWTSLHFASQNGHLDIVKFLTEQDGIGINIQDDEGKTPLHYASKYGYLDIVQFLSEQNGIDISIRDNDGWTPLHIASQKGHLEIVKFLTEQDGIDINIKDDEGTTPLQIAQENNQEDIAKYLQEIKSKKWKPIHTAAYNEHVASMKRLTENPKFKITNEELTTLNEIANNSENTYVKDYVLYIKKIFNKSTGRPWPALEIAVHHGNLQQVKHLIEQAEFFNILKEKEQELLDFARQSNNNEISEYLSYILGRIKKADWTQIQIMAYNGDLKQLKSLCNPSNINIQDRFNNTLLHIASQNGHLNIVKFLVGRNGIDMNAKNSVGNTPFHIASGHGHLNIVKFLSEQDGIDINVKGYSGFTPLHVASQKGHCDIVKFLVGQNGIDINIKHNGGYTPLHIASEEGHLEIVKVLVKRGEISIDINEKSNGGWTPLHIASEEGYLEIVDVLVKKGADVNARVHGKTSLQLAQEAMEKPGNRDKAGDYQEIIKILDGAEQKSKKTQKSKKLLKPKKKTKTKKPQNPKKKIKTTEKPAQPTETNS